MYSVDYSKDGKRFASGGADLFVVIWTNKGEGILKYEHTTSIQALAYNPVHHSLASVATGDFGIWNPEHSTVEKYPLNSKGLCVSWTSDGLVVAIGLQNGTVLLRDNNGKPNREFKRKAAVWGLVWNPVRGESSQNQLAVTCWDETLSMWDAEGVQVLNDKELGFLPCCVEFFANGEFLVVCGSNQQASLWTRDGVCLGTVGAAKEWLWSAAIRPKIQCVATGGNSGTIAMYEMHFSLAHGLFQDRYAHRELMTNVVIQHLGTEQKVRIKCKDLVKKISLYKEKIAMLLPTRVLLYAAAPEDESNMKYKSYHIINRQFECSLMVLVYYHVLICSEQRLSLCNFNGEIEREWELESPIRFLQTNGGPPGRESILVGLKSGQVCKLFVDNQFPVTLVKHTSPIRCVALSLYRTKLAIVDDNDNLLVHDLKTQQLVFQQTQVTAVAFNSEMEDMIAYSGENNLSIKTGTFPPAVQKMTGFVVGFKGSRIYSLHYTKINLIDLPQSAVMYKYLEQKDLRMAHSVASLGVTEQDWRRLAIEGLQAHDFALARKCFMRIKDIRFLDLVISIETERKAPGYNDHIMMGQVAAYQGRYTEAATLFVKGGATGRAVALFKELKQWDKAHEFAQKEQDKDKQRRLYEAQAEDAQDSDWRVSAQLFVNLGDLKRAVQLIGAKGDFK